MNTAKKIDINRSTLISLKAELSRKQEEVSLAKAQQQFSKPSTSEKSEKKKSNIWDKKSIGIESKKDEISEEEQDKYQKSRAALEAKARLYDELSSPNASTKDILAAQQVLLVDFKRKQREKEREEGETDDDVDDTPTGDYGDDDDWVEYTDCLGRTRKCLKADLPDVQRQNHKLADSLGMGKRSPSRSRSPSSSPERKPRPPTPPLEQQLVSGDLQREALREKWVKQEAEMLKKEDVHYQDLLFDEVRHHGVSYYGFSKDEKQRKAQQEQLAKVRVETKKQQNAAQENRARRAEQLKARLRAASNRRRQRQGLPPLPDSEEEVEKNASDEEAEMERMLGKEKPSAPAEPEPLVREEQPRPAVVRPWDKHKDYVMSQDEWTEKKRAERVGEFAPPSSLYGGLSGMGRSARRSRSRSPRRRRRSSSSSDDSGPIGPLPPKQPSQAPHLEDSIMAGLSFIRKKVEHDK